MDVRQGGTLHRSTGDARLRRVAMALICAAAALAADVSAGAGRNLIDVEVRFAAGDTARAVLVPAPGGVLPEVVAVDDGATCSLGNVARAAGIDVVPLVLSRAGTSSQPVAVTLRCRGTATPVRPRNVMASYLLREMVGSDAPVGQVGYLVVVPDEFYSNVQPLAEWKRRKGFVVWVKKTSETGSTREQIREYVRTAYNTWSPVPSYLLLVGAANKISPFVTPGTSCVTDHMFVCVDGTDYLADMFVGRLPAANGSELDVMVAKLLGYEMTPSVSDTAWFHRALMVGTSYQEGGSPAVTALVTLRQIRERLLGRGFATVDTVFYPPTFSGRGPVDTAVNRGVLYVNGRGWGNTSGWGYPQYNVTDVNNLANGWRLPVVTSIYCGTGNYVSGVNPCFGEAWLRAGTPTSPKGGAAFWGSSYTGTSTRWNNCMDYGIYHAIFDRGIRTAGPAMYAGKLEQLASFPLAQDSFDLRLYFHVYNLFGDPAMEMWTGVPRALQVQAPASYPVGASSFEVRALDGAGSPVSGAAVCLYKLGEVHEVALTDGAGRAGFAVRTTDADTMYVTTTGPNLAPHLGVMTGVAQGVFVGVLSHSPQTVGPGSSVDLSVTLKNYGTSQTASGVRVTLRAEDGYAFITDSVRDYGDLAPGQSHAAAPFGLVTVLRCSSGQRIPLRLSIASQESVWTAALHLPVSGPALVARSYTVHDANGVLDPGETAELSVTLHNRGGVAAGGVAALLRSLNTAAVTVLDSFGSFGTIPPGDSGANVTDRFQVRAAAGIAPGRRFSMKLHLAGVDGFESEHDLALTVGAPASVSPLGPDYHGYYCYDNTDAGYAERPEYAWVEVDPGQGGQGTRVDIGNDRAVPVNLPFTFRFYGADFNTVSVCDNGYLAMGSSWLGDPYNWHIPSASGPDGVVAVFWDDFRSDTLGVPGVFTWYDEAGHRFVVEWSRCRHVHGFRTPVIAEEQTFEVILLDPQYHGTRTGDGPLLLQYQTVQNDDSLLNNCHNFATVGIQAPGRSDGIEYTFAGSYPAAAAVLGPGRAVKFTTNPPDTFTAVNGEPVRVPPRPRIEAWPNPAAGRVRLAVSTPAPARVSAYNAAGRLVWTSGVVPEGASDLPWNGRDVRGLSLPAGVYHVVLTAAGGYDRITAGERVLLLR